MRKQRAVQRSMIANILYWLAAFWLLIAVTRGLLVPALVGVGMVLWFIHDWQVWLTHGRLQDEYDRKCREWELSHRETANGNGE